MSETVEWKVCRFCGEKVTTAAARCRHCGKFFDNDLQEDGGRFYKDHAGADENLQWLIPTGRSSWAIASGYLGLLSCLPYVGLVFGVLAVVLGLLALRRSERNRRLLSRWRAVFGIIVGGVAGVANLALTAATIYGAVNGWR